MTETCWRLSRLPKTWLIDLDGVTFKHNGWRRDSDEPPLPGVRRLWDQIEESDFVVVMSARPPELREASLNSLRRGGLRYDVALFGLPPGERLIINDRKPSGLPTAFALNVERDAGLAQLRITYDGAL